ncbi:MAG: hypothetical protein DMF56_27070 [Acidobacteria bacterium]|nr:MAG: hypothetical protein DMF56_27070 [Acidobacteriota bacterium]
MPNPLPPPPAPPPPPPQPADPAPIGAAAGPKPPNRPMPPAAVPEPKEEKKPTSAQAAPQVAPKQELTRPTNTAAPAPAAPAPATAAPAPAVHTTPKGSTQNLAETTRATPAQERAAAEAEARMAALAEVSSQANAVTGLVGDSGAGKTSQVCEAIEYAWEVYHRIGRVYHFDAGGFGNKLIRLAKLGIAQIWTPRNRIEPFETAELCSLGYWPEKIDNVETGFADPYVPLVPPQTRRWVIYCPNGHIVRTVSNRRLLEAFQNACPECRTLVTLQNWSKVDEQVIRSPGFRHVGLYVFDSVTAMSDHIMTDMAERAARDEMGGSDRNSLRGAPAKVISGSMVFGSNSMPHYGFAQNRVASWLANMRKIPYQVVPPIATFLENRGSDEANIAVFGPKIAGTARTADVPAWLGNCLNLTKVPTPSGAMKFRIWLETHAHPNEGNIPHLAKTRGEPGDFPPYLEDKEGQPPFSTCSLKFFFRRMDEALQRSLARASEQYRDAPALVPFTDDGEEDVLSETQASLGVTAGSHPSHLALTPPPVVAGAVSLGAPPIQAPVGVPMPPMSMAGIGVPPPPMAAAPTPPAAAPVPHREPVVAAPDAPVQAGLHLVPAAAAASPTAEAPAASGAPAVPPKTSAVRRGRPPLPSAGGQK